MIQAGVLSICIQPVYIYQHDCYAVGYPLVVLHGRSQEQLRVSILCRTGTTAMLNSITEGNEALTAQTPPMLPDLTRRQG